MGSELAMKPVSFEVIALLRSRSDLHSELSNSPLKMIFVASDKVLGGGEAVENVFDAAALEEAAGIFPL
jgi:hypothetical protein